MVTRRVIAVDPSLTLSGWAVFSINSNRLEAVGKIASLSPEAPMARRLLDLQKKIADVFEALRLGVNDVLVCEAPTTMRDPRAAFCVEQVRGIFETLARTRGVCVPGRINPRSVHHEVMGLRGRQLERKQVKEIAVRLVSTLFAGDLSRLGFVTDARALKRHQDIADAVLLGSVGVSWISSALRAEVSIEEFFDSRERRSRRRAQRRGLSGRRAQRRIVISAERL